MPHPTPFQLRAATPADTAALVDLEQQTFAYDRMSRAQFRRHLRSPTAAIWVAERSGALLGAAVLFFRRGGQPARLYSLATAASARGEGVGRRLLQTVESDALRRGHDRLRLEVRTDNAAAIRLYESSGYRRIAEKPGYYDDGSDAWQYEKLLTGASE
ncbi:GNAT family N-acetyltransferase [Tahibacter amnicola]|uniref:GNAT family N-acetyltransferase n=1 Tax=Tahibacter amnicola TaxID=2976241 RepID=A0ABY6BG85_9GAMM|nr:N-acetyltransferase [Tahibacter amnicola]UXI68527.1 GNAT family N-acetyltransferase [Tahibacter amnicola]